MKKIAILGSTGSIGTQTLEVVRNNSELQVVALAAGKSVEQMEQQIREFHPLIAGMWSEEAAADLRTRVADLPVKVVTGMDGLLEIAVLSESQVLVTAIVGMIGIRPTIAAIEAGKDIALANKETLRNLPVIERGTERQDREDPAHRIRRTLPWQDQRATSKYSGGGCLKASELVHGTEDHD